MALSDIQEQLREDPETVYINFAGEEKPFLLSTLGLERARQKADPVPKVFDLVQRYGALQSIFSEEETDWEQLRERTLDKVQGSDLSDISLIVWAGFLTFDKDITLEEIQLLMTPGRVAKYGRKVVASVTTFLQDFEPEEGDVPDEEEQEVKN